MTTKYELPADLFAGETVVVIAPGPSATRELVDSVRQYKRIAVRRAFELVPDADMLVALDGASGSADDSFWDDARDFSGLKITGTESDELDALYLPMPHEVVTLSEQHVVHIRNSGLAAIRIAARAGAAKILLIGFEPEKYESDKNTVLTVGLARLIEELRVQGIEVERLPSAEEISAKSSRETTVENLCKEDVAKARYESMAPLTIGEPDQR